MANANLLFFRIAAFASTIIATASANAQWTVTNMHPVGAVNSSAIFTSGSQHAGFASFPEGGEQAGRWNDNATSWVGVRLDGFVAAMTASQQVGSVSYGFSSHASLWNGSVASRVDLNPDGSTGSLARTISGSLQAGYALVGGRNHASLWSGTAASWVDLHPAGALSSDVSGAFGSQQVGWADMVSGGTHAGVWSGTASSWVDLHPPSLNSGGAGESRVYATTGSQQVGAVVIGVYFVDHASLWRGTAASWVDLNPSGAWSSIAYAASGSQQVGYTVIDEFGGPAHASLWSGTAASWIDLHAILPVPSAFFASEARSIFTDAVRTYIVGYASNALTGNTEAMLWTHCRADFDFSGTRTVNDLFLYISAWFTNVPVADFDGSGNIDVGDLFGMITAWFSACP